VVHFQPADLKYLPKTAHKNLERWIIRAGWILVTCSGTVGQVAIAPPQWDGWAASQHILRIVPDPSSPCPPGYLYAFLISPAGQAQLTAQIYGAVVDELTEEQARSVLIPVPKTKKQIALVKSINDTALRAAKRRAEAADLATASVAEVSDLLPGMREEQPGDEATGLEAFERFHAATQALLQVPKSEIAGR
jgi:type I restriction enzyme S subunit